MSEPQRPRTTPAPTGREHILKAALDEFAEVGFEAASVTRIAKRAGVTQPLIHHHFGTKLALWKAIVDEAFAEFNALEAKYRVALATLEPATRIRLLVRQAILFGLRRPELARLMLFEAARDGEARAYAVETHLAPMMNRMRAEIDEAARAGIVRTGDTKLFLVAGLGATSFLMFVSSVGKLLFDVDASDPATASRYADLVVDLLFAKGSGPKEKAE